MKTTWVTVPDEALEQTRTLNNTVETWLAANPALHTVAPSVTRENRADGRGVFGPLVLAENAEDRQIGDDVSVRVITPKTVDGVYLHLHGGGWTLGASNQQDVPLARLAEESNLAVVSVDYGLAPEAPYPAGNDDCESAAAWLVENAKAEFGTDRLLIGGESAGAHLAALTLLRLRDRHGAINAFSGANLVFGCYDLSLSPSVRMWGDRNLILSEPIIEWFVENYTPGMSREARRDPDVSPLYADLRDMPPALFSVGTLDPLVDDSMFMAARWEAAGNDAELVVYPESMHGFTGFPTAVAELATQAQTEFLRQHVS